MVKFDEKQLNELVMKKIRPPKNSEAERMIKKLRNAVPPRTEERGKRL